MVASRNILYHKKCPLLPIACTYPIPIIYPIDIVIPISHMLDLHILLHFKYHPIGEMTKKRSTTISEGKIEFFVCKKGHHPENRSRKLENFWIRIVGPQTQGKVSAYV